jgi:hypothetical protein
MRRDILALTCAAAALVAGASWAQENRGFGEGGSCKKAPPGSGEQLCIDDGTAASRGRTAEDIARANRSEARLPAASVASTTTTSATPSAPWPADETASVAATPEPAAASTTVTTELVASAPVPDTPANRARYGQPMSNAGKRTAARGN